MIKRLLSFLLIFLLSVPCYAANYLTNNYNFEIPAIGSRDWNTLISNDIISMDTILYIISQDSVTQETKLTIITNDLNAYTGPLINATTDISVLYLRTNIITNDLASYTGPLVYVTNDVSDLKVKTTIISNDISVYTGPLVYVTNDVADLKVKTDILSTDVNTLIRDRVSTDGILTAITTDTISGDTYRFDAVTASPDVVSGAPTICVSTDTTGVDHLNIYINGVWREISLS